ncbi:hypothetical protein [Corallococcus llansteffanensis]|uniref:hypothetical protein n=1 Tax=Corallococcus llansteffanensis TaxID=2316731 RepID=UPI0011C394AB|nr:hypothetical protein [Corallococcus llansteffanensis]
MGAAATTLLMGESRPTSSQAPEASAIGEPVPGSKALEEKVGSDWWRANLHSAFPVVEPANLLLQGLVASKVAPEEDGSPGDRKALRAIERAWVDAKMIDKPFTQQDYSHFYKPLSEFELFGRKVLAVEYEYLEEWIGCCVNNGFSVLLSNTAGDDVSLHRFARENNCRVRVGKDVCCTPLEWEAQEKAGKFIRLSCRESDSYADEASEE